jgi:hypothetical protein
MPLIDQQLQSLASSGHSKVNSSTESSDTRKDLGSLYFGLTHQIIRDISGHQITHHHHNESSTAFDAIRLDSWRSTRSAHAYVSFSCLQHQTTPGNLDVEALKDKSRQVRGPFAQGRKRVAIKACTDTAHTRQGMRDSTLASALGVNQRCIIPHLSSALFLLNSRGSESVAGFECKAWPVSP